MLHSRSEAALSRYASEAQMDGVAYAGWASSPPNRCGRVPRAKSSIDKNTMTQALAAIQETSAEILNELRFGRAGVCKSIPPLSNAERFADLHRKSGPTGPEHDRIRPRP
jgi:hypothetical protein